MLATLERYNIDARYEKVGETSVATNQSSVDRLRTEYEKEKAEGEDVVFFDREAMQAEVNSPTSTRFCMVPGVTCNGRVACAVGYTGLGVGATRFGARVGIELLGYQPSDILKMKFVTKRPMA